MILCPYLGSMPMTSPQTTVSSASVAIKEPRYCQLPSPGDYFLAELIESQDCDHKTFVAEVQTDVTHCTVSPPLSCQVGGHAVGFISVTTKVDLRVLSSCFQLETYHDLRHPAPLDQGTYTHL